MVWNNQLYFGDNLPVLRKHIKDESIDLIYIEAPFHSKKNDKQIYVSDPVEKLMAMIADQLQALMDRLIDKQTTVLEALRQEETQREGRKHCEIT